MLTHVVACSFFKAEIYSTACRGLTAYLFICPSTPGWLQPFPSEMEQVPLTCCFIPLAPAVPPKSSCPDSLPGGCRGWTCSACTASGSSPDGLGAGGECPLTPSPRGGTHLLFPSPSALSSLLRSAACACLPDKPIALESARSVRLRGIQIAGLHQAHTHTQRPQGGGEAGCHNRVCLWMENPMSPTGAQSRCPAASQ